MSLNGQCPACFEVNAVDSRQLGTVIGCRCGASLFVCDARAFDEIPIHCASCDESYLAPSEDVGEVVECECGSDVQVCEVVFQASLVHDDEFEEAVEHSSVAPEPIVVQDDASGIVVETEKSSDDEERRSPRKGRKSKRSDDTSEPRGTGQKSWLPIAGLIAVTAFFLFAVGMFFLNRSRQAEAKIAAAEKINAQRARAARSKATARDPSVVVPIEKRVLDRLLATVPTPDFAGVPARSQGASLQASSDPANEQPSAAVNTPNVMDGKSPFGGRTLKRTRKLPRPGKPRERLSLEPVKRPSRIFSSAYQYVFESYEALTALNQKPDAEPSAEYKQLLGETLSLAKMALALSGQSEDQQKRNEICYLLAFLSHSAGHLMEASIYGEAVARTGKVDDPSTHEALMIALAATQEANLNHWGIAENVGELRQMKRLAHLVDKRWPKDPQRDVIWLSLAQSFSEFGYPVDAANALARVPKGSAKYASAQLASGMAHWNHFVDQASHAEPEPVQMIAFLKRAQKQLEVGVGLVHDEVDQPTLELVTAKLTLAKIAGRLSDSSGVLSWLTEAPMPVVGSVTMDRKDSAKVLIDEGTAKTIFDLLYQARYSQGDLVAADKTLEQRAEFLGVEISEGGAERETALAIAFLRKLLSQKNVETADVERLENLLSPLLAGEVQWPATNQLWLAESYVTLANRTAVPELSSRCISFAADRYSAATKQDDFPRASLQSAMRRHAELLRLAGRTSESLEILVGILAKVPNAIELQIQVALAQQQAAFDEPTVNGLRQAIDGDSDTAVWGWSKLTRNLHALRFSEKGTKRHADQLLESQFHLARCGWLVARTTNDDNERSAMLGRAQKQVERLLVTMPKSSSGESNASRSRNESRRRGFETLLTQLKSPAE